MKEALDKVKLGVVPELARMARKAVENANLKIEAETIKFASAELPPLRQEAPAIAERFMQNLSDAFDAVTTFKTREPSLEELDYDSLSLVDHTDLEAILAMEGMVNHARNSDIREYVSFTTRLEALFPNVRINESNNPLDPEQIGSGFAEALKPMGLKSHYQLTIYREFNKEVFHNLESILADANDILIELGVLPKLDIRARNREKQRAKRAANRPTIDIESRVFAEAANASVRGNAEESTNEMFVMMRSLVNKISEHERLGNTLPLSGGGATSNDKAAAQLADEQKEIKAQQAKLHEILTSIQATLTTDAKRAENAGEAASAITRNITDSLMVESGKYNKVMLDDQSTDVINLVTLLYEAIWEDDSLPLVMKELIGRTQIAIMKVALSDVAFFDNEAHPGRALLNELTTAGISWTDKEMLKSDPMYSMMKDLIERLNHESMPDSVLLQQLTDELKQFKNKMSDSDRDLEIRIREAEDYNDRIDEVHDFVAQKISERVLKAELDPSVRYLLGTHMHDFLVKLIMREGPGGSSWRPVMATIDALLWSVQPEKQEGDRKRFERLQPRLTENLEKALKIAGTEASKIRRLMDQLFQIQEHSFRQAELAREAGIELPKPLSLPSIEIELSLKKHKEKEEPKPLPSADPHVRQVEKLPIGVWLEFRGIEGNPIRCTLVARIDSVDKMLFVNAQGVKMVELTPMQLARELKAGTVKIISESNLINRALETVIAKLRAH